MPGGADGREKFLDGLEEAGLADPKSSFSSFSSPSASNISRMLLTLLALRTLR